MSENIESTLQTIPNTAETLLRTGRDLANRKFEVQYENGTPFIVHPADLEITELEHLRKHPLRIEQKTNHTTAESFVNYFNRFGDEYQSAVFIDEVNAKFTAILDYHEPYESNQKPGWKKHISTFSPEKTPEWKSWLENDKKGMSQEAFGQFIENNIAEIQEPSGAEMLEIALSIQAKTEVKFNRATRLDNGQLQITYNEVTNGTAGVNGQLKIPEKFTIGLRLFRGGDAYKIDARLRYRIKEGNLTLWYELIRPHATIDANLDDITNLILAGIPIETAIYRGTANY
jgi:uncharacterized protein YfdQ (DUF2303 family)